MRPVVFVSPVAVAAGALLLALVPAAGSLASSGGAANAVATGHSNVRLAQQQKAAPKAGTPAKQEAGEPAAWAVTCSDRGQAKFTCEMIQNIIDQKSRGQVMLLSIRNTEGGQSKAMLIRLLHGVYLPSGVSIKIDGGQAIPVAFQKSDQHGVYAALPLTDKLVADLKKAKEMRFTMEINQGQPLEVAARLNGFGPAFDRISSMR